ncbi:MAG: SpoVA/SpoVAEb family sporulation membrane protein [Clostridiales bacterium]|nr:SpoVA/SpoVAEb family sporulation membrane protein [Clostridiales bacterium]
MTEKEYEKLVQKAAPKSPMGKDCLNAFWIGGLICVLGQVLTNTYGSMGLDKDAAATATSITLVVLSALLTGLSLYDDLAKYGGAGTLVPITGFANAIAAPAVEFKTDECAIIGPSHRAPVQGEYDDLVQTPIRKGGGYKRRWEHP